MNCESKQIKRIFKLIQDIITELWETGEISLENVEAEIIKSGESDFTFYKFIPAVMKNNRYEVEEPVRCFEKVLRVAKEIFEIEAMERESNKNSK